MTTVNEYLDFKSILTTSGLSGKTITGLNAYTNGSVTVIEVVAPGGTVFLKVRQGQMEVGGTAVWGTGTLIPSNPVMR